MRTLFGGKVFASAEAAIKADAEKGKARMDFKRLKQLKSDLEAQLARDEQRIALEAQLAAAMETDDYGRCDEIQEQLDVLSAKERGAAFDDSSDAPVRQQEDALDEAAKRSARAYARELAKVVEASDVVLEVLDARDPAGSRSSRVESAVRRAPGKRLVLVLNKVDLPGADVTTVSQEIESTLGIDCTDAIPASAKNGIGVPDTDVATYEALVTRLAEFCSRARVPADPLEEADAATARSAPRRSDAPARQQLMAQPRLGTS